MAAVGCKIPGEKKSTVEGLNKYVCVCVCMCYSLYKRKIPQAQNRGCCKKKTAVDTL